MMQSIRAKFITTFVVFFLLVLMLAGFGGAIGLALLLDFTGPIWIYLHRILVQPLRRLTAGIDEIRSTGLDRELGVTSRDEIGQLGA